MYVCCFFKLNSTWREDNCSFNHTRNYVSCVKCQHFGQAFVLCTTRTRAHSVEGGNVCAHPVYSRATEHLRREGSYVQTPWLHLVERRGEVICNVSSVDLNATKQQTLKQVFHGRLNAGFVVRLLCEGLPTQQVDVLFVSTVIVISCGQWK